MGFRRTHNCCSEALLWAGDHITRALRNPGLAGLLDFSYLGSDPALANVVQVSVPL